MTDHSAMKLGRLPKREDPRVPMMAALLTPDLPPVPASCDWTKGLSEWGMMDNDQIGDCTACGVAHIEQVWTLNVRGEWTASTEQTVGFYSASTGYVPGQPNTDQGGVEIDVLTYWLKNGFCGRHIGGFASIEASNIDHVKQAIHQFGGIYIGANLPLASQPQSVFDLPVGQSLTGDWEPGSWGGHCMVAAGYDAEGVTFITWGKLMKATWAWWNAYVDEAYAITGGAWIGNDGHDPIGVDWTKLEMYMQALKGA